MRFDGADSTETTAQTAFTPSPPPQGSQPSSETATEPSSDGTTDPNQARNVPLEPGGHDGNLLANTQYALRARAINSLRDLGIEQLGDIPLPKIAIVGDQSSGKSSLIEAISQIKLPQGIGRCTRCPMEVRLETSGSPWTCIVSVRFDEHPDPAMLGTHPFQTTNDRDEAEDIIRRAQLAILNPSKDLRNFKQLDLSIYNEGEEYAFSKNAVIVDVKGAPVDVTFIDLPGLISADQVLTIDRIPEFE